MFIKPYLPFDLIFAQHIENRTEARDLEKFLKIRFNKEAVLELIAGMVKLEDTLP